MKRIISLIAVGIAYVIFVVAFSFFNNNITSAQTDGTVQNTNIENSLSGDPAPPPGSPPFPPMPPPPPGG